MNFNFAQKINPALEKLDFSKALTIAETALKKIPKTAFHDILGLSLVDQAGELADWINIFYKKAVKKLDIKALYFEMNEFDINTDQWFIDCFAFSRDGGLDPDDMDWLCDFEADSWKTTKTNFIIEGLEKLQSAFRDIALTTSRLKNARDWCEQIVIARFMELMRAAHISAKEKKFAWAAIPLYFTEHEYDFVVRSN